MSQPTKWQIIIILTIGIIGVSLAAIWIRLAFNTVNPNNKTGFSLFLAASRLIFAATILLPSWQNFKLSQSSAASIYYGIAAGICLAIHFATWITSLAYTSIAASTVLVTTNPIWVGLINWWWYQEKLNKQNMIGIAIALGGGILIAISGNEINTDYPNLWLGNVLALIGAIMSSLYIIFGTQARRLGLKTNNYIAIAYSVAAICLFPLPLFYQTSYFNYPVNIYIYILLMAIMSQVIGHTSLNWVIRWISPTVVSLSLLLEPIVASCLSAILFQEIPTIDLLSGGIIILLGITIFLAQDKNFRM